MDYTTHTRLGPAELTDATLLGATIYDAEDEKIGTITHLHRQGAEPQAVLDVGGFPGVQAKRLLVNLSELAMLRDHTGAILGIAPRTKQQLMELPAHGR